MNLRFNQIIKETSDGIIVLIPLSKNCSICVKIFWETGISLSKEIVGIKIKNVEELFPFIENELTNDIKSFVNTYLKKLLNEEDKMKINKLESLINEALNGFPREWAAYDFNSRLISPFEDIDGI